MFRSKTLAIFCASWSVLLLFSRPLNAQEEKSAAFRTPLFEKIEAKPFIAIDTDEISMKPFAGEKRSHFDFGHVLKKSKYEITCY